VIGVANGVLREATFARVLSERGRAVAKTSWQDLLADYNLAEGRTWPLVLAWIALGPAIVREVQGG
jgi:hypothetical protein